MRLLIDTNIFLEVILEQEKAEEARNLLSNIDKHDFFISDYSLHSIGLLLFHRKQHHVFRQFLTDMISNAGVKMTNLLAKDMETIINAAQRFNLDFDDAYQFVVAEKYDLKIISFDSDFDRTEKGRIKPGKVNP
ncbi:type II toxin-antitoxin system VapC family toxin [candidate division WOR-3 bacterium]|nr:type II toxin-antitoxin system VapC family toxin [candidate division WOR-3 bacterium]